MIALALSTILAAPFAQNSVIIDYTVENGDIYCDIQARDYPVRGLMESLCRKLDYELTGFEDIDSSATVSVFLHHRPLGVTVEYLLGAAGLAGTVGTKRIDVNTQSLPFPSSEHSLRAAEISFISALQRFPEGPFALNAREELAEISLLAGEPEKAARHYDMLAGASTIFADEVSARMKAGLLYVDLQEWGNAIPHFQEVGNIEIKESMSDEEFTTLALARRELARCILMRGEARRAYYMLSGLNQVIAPRDTKDETIRLSLSARAKIGMGDYDEGLLELDRALQMGAIYIDEFDSMDLRATALEAKGHPVEAATAWIHFSRGKKEEVKQASFVKAAQIALSVEGEELGVILLHKHATNEGVGDALIPYLNEARTRLGLDAASYTDGTITMRLRRAMALVSTGFNDEATATFKSVARDFRDLSANDRVEFALTYAPLVEKKNGPTFAVDVLRKVVESLESVENRTKLYLLAGEILERNKMFDDAAAAYGGQL
ncbi:MAG: tetratricopeptide (TPR) repeat protein [Planctomycetota bacterium]|jgi:tetratricopeptide (TPR) repeat protein